MFAFVANSLALVGFGLADGPDFGGKLADLLFVATLDHDVRLIGAGDIQAGRNLFVDFVGEADTQLQRVALHGGQVTDADDLQLLFVAFGDADRPCC